MLDKNIAHDVINCALEHGADFCDIFVEKKDSQSVSFNSSEVKDIQSGMNFGIGVRLIYGTKSLYAYTNSKERDDLIKLTQTLAASYKTGSQALMQDQFNTLTYQEIKSFINKEMPLEEKINNLKSLDSKIRAQGEYISQVNISMIQYQQNIEVFNSKGLYAHEVRPYCRVATNAIAKDGDKQCSGSWNPGARGGDGFLDSLDHDWIAEYLGKKTKTVLYAEPCPAKTMDVVIDNGFGGVIFHEACGHLLETTSVEKKSSVFWDKKGEMIAHENLSAVDDGTIDNLWGSISIDDEGMPTQRTQLIKNGKLENFLSDTLGEMKTGHKRTGSARRQSYKFAPASRMRNTFIEEGPHSNDEIIQSIGDGLYCKSMGGGSVNPGTGEFNFAVEEGYLIKNGKLDKAVKGATLIGRGEKIMKNISMVGKNLDFAAGMCGSVSGSVPVTVGQPMIKVENILVGGNS